jgi:ribonuclease J
MRAISGTHQDIQLKDQDMVVFSADAIPGNELNYYGAIDELSINRIQTIYPAIDPEIHHSGHANAPEQAKLLELVQPQHVMPIGGQNRHRLRYLREIAAPLGFQSQQVVLPREGEIIGITADKIKVVDLLNLRPQYVDGLGIGDVGPSVLNDRQVLSQAGMIIVIVKRYQGKFDLKDIHVVSRGFVFMRDATEVLDYIKSRTAEIIGEQKVGRRRDFDIVKQVERKLGRSLYKIIEREPMIEVEIVHCGQPGGGSDRSRPRKKSSQPKDDARSSKKNHKAQQ